MYDVREMHLIMEDDYAPYMQQASDLIHESMNLYPIDTGMTQIEDFEALTHVKAHKVEFWLGFMVCYRMTIRSMWAS